eukprot:TRINITY_DN5667_c0_g1_i1.p1 TRINITY_DN5667_c0_g1~~TRINITY_DN5667_c0_g1_i1.p1  ORF type:complete len:337 (+),score=77.98 TRINITY_DN5667_c0_g1_i1:32-1042(+)
MSSTVPKGKPETPVQKVIVLHENDEWTEALRMAMDALDVPYDVWHIGAGGSLDMNEAPPDGIFYNRMSPSSHSRDHRYGPEYTHAVLEWLELHDRTVVNGIRALDLEMSKVKQYRSLEQHGLKTPRTAVAAGSDKQSLKTRLVDTAAKYFKDEAFITKHNRAGKGLGVKLFRSIQSLKDWTESEDFEVPVDGLFLVQQYIVSATSHITRSEFVNGKNIYSVKVDTSNGFELCPADACSVGDAFCPGVSEDPNKPKPFEIIDYDHPNLERYRKFLETNNIAVAGIEHITGVDGITYTYDVNTTTNYNGNAEWRKYQSIEAGGMYEVAKYLKELLVTA